MSMKYQLVRNLILIKSIYFYSPIILLQIDFRIYI